MSDRFVISVIIILSLGMAGIVGYAYVAPQQSPESNPSSSEEQQSEQIQPRLRASPTHNFPIVDIVKDSQYWNAAWDTTELYQKLVSINKSYCETHTYIKGVFDCNDMTIDLWNILHKQGITSVIVVGNLELDKERFRECDHTWLLIQHSRDGSLYRCFVIESTNGEVYAFDLKTKAFAQYTEGYYYSSPSNFKEDNQERF